ncbi:MAG: clan AA aspartic protease [Armatimonadetes bacterium]|nr:clan AA aspartic protease [Armatimonadota bacterium]
MISGQVTPAREAVTRLLLRGTAGREEEIQAVIDTGFNGALTLPPALVAALGLPPRGHRQVALADGSHVLLSAYRTIVIWDGTPRAVAVRV